MSETATQEAPAPSVPFDDDYGTVSAEFAKEAAEANQIPDGWYRIAVEKFSKVDDADKKEQKVYQNKVDTGITRPNPYLGFRLIKTTFLVYTPGAEKPRKSTTNVSPDKVTVESRVQMASVLGGQLAKATGTAGGSFKATLDAGMVTELYGRFGAGYLNEITEKKPAKLLS